MGSLTRAAGHARLGSIVDVNKTVDAPDVRTGQTKRLKSTRTTRIGGEIMDSVPGAHGCSAHMGHDDGCMCDRNINAAGGFDLDVFLSAAGLGRTVIKCRAGELIFSEADIADSVMYVQQGRVKLSVFSKTREGVVAILASGEFFGEDCLSGQSFRMKSATAMTKSTILVIAKATMRQLLHVEPSLSDRFIEHLLLRNVRIEEDLADQLVSSCEQRLARVLLRLARCGAQSKPKKIRPPISQATLAGMVGSTRPRVNQFLQKFKALGFVNMGRPLIVNPALRRAVSDRRSRSARPLAAARVSRTGADAASLSQRPRTT